VSTTFHTQLVPKLFRRRVGFARRFLGVLILERSPSVRWTYDACVVERIVSLVPAESGWRAMYGSEGLPDSESARIVAWALVEDGDGAQRVVGMVVGGDDPTMLVPAPDAVSELAPRFERYGFTSR
jgi:hypothetical protein